MLKTNSMKRKKNKSSKTPRKNYKNRSAIKSAKLLLSLRPSQISISTKAQNQSKQFGNSSFLQPTKEMSASSRRCLLKKSKVGSSRKVLLWIGRRQRLQLKMKSESCRWQMTTKWRMMNSIDCLPRECSEKLSLMLLRNSNAWWNRKVMRMMGLELAEKLTNMHAPKSFRTWSLKASFTRRLRTSSTPLKIWRSKRTPSILRNTS